MKALFRCFCVLTGLSLIFASCGGDKIIDTAQTTEALTEATETLAPETSAMGEMTFEETAEDEITEAETTADNTAAEETTLVPLPEGMSAIELLLTSLSLVDNYRSYVRVSSTSTDIDVLGSLAHTETSSELRVSGDDASFVRGGKDGFDKLYLIGGEFYRKGTLADYRIGGYTRAEFLDELSDPELASLFKGGNATRDEEGFFLQFAELTEEGIAEFSSMLSLAEGYSSEIIGSELSLKLDIYGNMIESRLSVELEVKNSKEVLMTARITTETVQSDIGASVPIDRPDPDQYIFFDSAQSLALFESTTAQAGTFIFDHPVFEYTVRDDMSISSGLITLPLTYKETYAYDTKHGAGIKKFFDVADGTGPHNTLTYFNHSSGYTQIDGGSVFIDTTVNPGNIEFTLSHPFATSMFALSYCTGMREAKEGMIALDLSETAAKSIAKNILLHAGVYVSDPEIAQDCTAYTYVVADEQGLLSRIGYEFSATVTVRGTSYKLTRSVSLNIDSREKATIKKIFAEPDDRFD